MKLWSASDECSEMIVNINFPEQLAVERVNGVGVGSLIAEISDELSRAISRADHDS